MDPTGYQQTMADLSSVDMVSPLANINFLDRPLNEYDPTDAK